MMMQLRRLLLLGIPACGSNTPNQGPVEPSHALPVAALGESPQPATSTSPPAATFDAKTCKIDQVPQSICGYYDDTCEVGPLRTDSTICRNQIANEWNTQGWLLDPETTKVWQEREHAQCPGCIITHTCCLSVCVSLDVGDAPPLSPKPIPPPDWHGDMWKEEWCLLKPPNGTTAPSTISPACPTGVTLADERRPLVQATDTECCY